MTSVDREPDEQLAGVQFVSHYAVEDSSECVQALLLLAGYEQQALDTAEQADRNKGKSA